MPLAIGRIVAINQRHVVMSRSGFVGTLDMSSVCTPPNDAAGRFAVYFAFALISPTHLSAVLAPARCLFLHLLLLFGPASPKGVEDFPIGFPGGLRAVSLLDQKESSGADRQ